MQRADLIAKPPELGNEQREFSRGTLGHAGELHYPLLILHRQLLHQDRIEHREHGTRHADAEAEDEDGGDGEGGRAAKGAEPGTEVPAKRI